MQQKEQERSGVCHCSALYDEVKDIMCMNATLARAALLTCSCHDLDCIA